MRPRNPRRGTQAEEHLHMAHERYLSQEISTLGLESVREDFKSLPGECPSRRGHRDP
ncbi:unnamed protein product, partial [Lampetra planeri]